jgi:hypothetical protein
MPDRSALTSARTTLQASRTALADAIYQLTVAQQNTALAQRLTPSALTDAQTAESRAQQAVAAARSALSSAQTALNGAIGSWLGNFDYNGDISRLEAASPIVLFPVRIETRFTSTMLNVRVYPDEIFLNSHETALTPDELAAGQKYYNDLNTGGAATEKPNWAQMVRDFGSLRAAYILRITLPVFAETSSSGSSSSSSCFIPTGHDDPLIFPTDIHLRAATWTRATEAVLPDRWIVMTRRGNTRNFFPGKPIPEPLAMTADPNADPTTGQTQLPNGLTVDDGSRWTIEFQRAFDIGMAIQVPLTSQDLTHGFDRLVVFGVKTSLAALDTSTLLEQLMDAHHYTRGVAFVRQGTATNNTKSHPTEYPPADDAGLASFGIERIPPPCDRFIAHPVLPYTADGYFWTKLLGVPSGVVQNVDRAYEQEHENAAAMTTALWPVTYGAFLQFMMSPIFTPAQIANAKSYFIDNVFPRGPAPTIRIGAVPYGILPAASLGRWQARGLGSSNDEAIEAALLAPLQLAVPIWKNASSKVAQITPNSANPQTDLAKVMALYPSAREMRLRFGLGPQITLNLADLLLWDIAAVFGQLDLLTSDLFGRFGHPEWRPRIGRTLFYPGQALETTPFVDKPQNLSETTTLSQDYLNGIATATAASLIANTVPNKPSSDSLLYELLRTSTLTEYARVADAFLQGQPFYLFPWLNYEIFGLTGLPSTSSGIISLLQQKSIVPPASGFATLGDYVQNQSGKHVAALQKLATASTAELDRLLTETVDVSSHRIDAWVTAFATRRVFALRTAQEQASMSPLGTFFGGYGWVENLRPETAPTVTAPDGSPANIDPTNGGFIHAPSTTHAMAAAVLRNGFLTRNPEDPQKYAFDLTSRRVRKALKALQEVRAGLHFGEVLGYLFERGLQEGHPGVPGLNALRFTFRNLYPLVAGKDGVDTSPANVAAARTVVDGLALYRAFQAATIPFGSNGLPTQGTSSYAAVQTELANLRDLVDAVGDLLTAEGVYQLVSGNVTGATPSLDNLINGGVPPNPTVVQSPRAGRGLTHTVVYAFQGAPAALPANWPTTLTPRASAEPTLNAWLGTILGDPARVTAKVNITRESGQSSASVTLQALAIHPLDLLALASATAQPNQAGLLDALITVAAVGDDPTVTSAKVDYSADPNRDPSKDRNFSEIIELLRALRGVLSSSRPLAVADLLSPADQTDTLPQVEPTALANAQEILARAEGAVTALENAHAQIDDALKAFDANNAASFTNLLASLRNAAAIAPERALVPSGMSQTSAIDLGGALLKELDARDQTASAIKGALPSTPTSGQVLQAATAILQTVFGQDFFAMPQVSAPQVGELQQAFAGQSTLLGTDGTRAATRFLQQAAHGRPQLANYRKFGIYARSLGAPAPGVQVAQIPFDPTETWLALPFTTEPEESRLSFLLLSASGPLDPSLDWQGIVLDSWIEAIPAQQQPTAIAFNYNSPRPNAPSCVLVVPPSSTGNNWVPADLVATLEETLDLAKVRAVDRELLDLGQILPAIDIPNSIDANVTVSSGKIGATVSLGSFFQVGFT